MAWTELISRVRWQDVADVLILTVLVFRVYLWLRGTAAMQVVWGLAAVLLAAAAASEAGLILTEYLLTGAAAVGSLVLVVVFQAEIRRALRRASPLRLFGRRRRVSEPDDRYDLLAQGLLRLARKRMGALVVIPGDDPLDDHLSGGTRIDAEIGPELLEAIFSTSSPIHDGAAVLTGRRLTRVGAFLPLSSSPGLPQELGSRHRAAAGLAERTDAVVVVVSEERGDLRIVCGDQMTAAPLSRERLARYLRDAATEHRTEGAPRAAATPGPRRLASAATFVLLLAIVSTLWYAVAFDRPAVLVLTRPVELRDPPSALEVSVEQPESGAVQVYVQGSRRLLYTSNHVRAWVDLSNVTPGRHWLRVRTEVPAGLEVVRIDPGWLVIQVQRS